MESRILIQIEFDKDQMLRRVCADSTTYRTDSCWNWAHAVIKSKPKRLRICSGPIFQSQEVCTTLSMRPRPLAAMLYRYLVPERKLGFFVKIKEDENFNHSNTDSISRIKIWVWRRYWRKRQFSFRHYLPRTPIPGKNEHCHRTRQTVLTRQKSLQE